MIKSFKSHSGKTYSLEGCIIKGNDIKTMRQLDYDFHEKAIELSKQNKTHFFYCLKKHISNGYEYCQYFTIPIDEYDIEQIPFIYNDYWIGIAYYHDAPDITIEEKLKIRQSYWNKKSGYEYEKICAYELRNKGFQNVEVTKSSGDQGVDIIAWKNGLKYGIQCKYYQGSVSNKAVQEVFAGAKHYNCNVAVVMTNSIFTESAKELARSIGVKLWSSSDSYKEV